MKEENTKSKVLNAAISLFNVKGYAGTSVREIAKEANVNLALISYYFGGKDGLLEHCISSFYEGYLDVLNDSILLKSNENACEALKDALLKLLIFQHENQLLARFVHREMTIDTMLVREVMTTYLMKEKYMFQQLLEKGIREGVFREVNNDYTVMHIRNLVTMPYLHPQYVKENFYIQLEEMTFVDTYYTYLCDVIYHFICKSK